ncbi:MAG TPA: mycofactocin biosynthesis glycosyltransferase MftF [Geomonas sp.]|nr:mycofactocin biosynthesis glycosyltransferase MftF [Geomonas sp.]
MNYRMVQGVDLVERDGATFLMSRSPLALVRLNAPLVALARRAMAGPVEAASAGEAAVLEQLAGKGFLERLRSVACADKQAELPSISIVIPVLDRAGELARCLESIAKVDYPRDKVEVIVVDDGSLDESPEVARKHGAFLVSSGGVRRGPAAARNVGALNASGELLAFIDSDCSASTGWLSELVPLFANPKLAAVGGRVDGMCSSSAVDRYEAVMSSLSLGTRERFGSSGDDTFYLPSCNLLVRRDLFLSVNGFEDSMHVGEDVDLTWRLRDAGWTIAYLPAGSILHEHRSSVRSFMSRRFDYGTSEGTLQKLHPQRKKRFVLSPRLGVVLALCLLAPYLSLWLYPAASLLLVADALVCGRKLAKRGVPLAFCAVLGGRLRALGSLAYYLSYHLVRYYALLLGALSVALPGLWAVALGALLTSAGVDYRIKKPRLSFFEFLFVYLLEQVAYGAGVFWGCLRGRGFASYRVTILGRMEVTA